MQEPLVRIKTPSIYDCDLPKRMAWLTEDAYEGLIAVREDIRAKGGALYLSDAFRSAQAQMKAHIDYLWGNNKRDEADLLIREWFPDGYVPRAKRAFSPMPGAGLHQAGRAVDWGTEKKYNEIGYWKCREIFEDNGWTFITNKRGNEEWHCEFRADYQRVRDVTGSYGLMAKLAIYDTGQDVKDIDKVMANIAQSILKRQGYYKYKVDGLWGPLSAKALDSWGGGTLESSLHKLIMEVT
ncbi:D-alanyl-D-alanine carboxypeptidase family protein [Pseudomonadales bacterium]|nr:D-alanyl-D-alanine carboxypeptidase family protein [Pseudomonadales bacterium]